MNTTSPKILGKIYDGRAARTIKISNKKLIAKTLKLNSIMQYYLVPLCRQGCYPRGTPPASYAASGYLKETLKGEPKSSTTVCQGMRPQFQWLTLPTTSTARTGILLRRLRTGRRAKNARTGNPCTGAPDASCGHARWSAVGRTRDGRDAPGSATGGPSSPSAG